MTENKMTSVKEAQKEKRDYLSLRLNPVLKQEFYGFCKSKGFAAGSAVRLFICQFAECGQLPWGLDVDRSRPGDNSARVSIHMDAETREMFAAACKKQNDISMSIVVRDFMEYCVTNNCFPYDENGNPRPPKKQGRNKANK